jgi:hypothetical protein
VDRLEELREVLHPEAAVELMVVQPGTSLRGREQILAFLEHELERRLWETVVHVCTTVDETRVVVEGRVRWTDDDRVMRDEARAWGLEFRDGLLLRSIPARNPLEAEALLARAG